MCDCMFMYLGTKVTYFRGFFDILSVWGKTHLFCLEWLVSYIMCALLSVPQMGLGIFLYSPKIGTKWKTKFNTFWLYSHSLRRITSLLLCAHGDDNVCFFRSIFSYDEIGKFENVFLFIMYIFEVTTDIKREMANIKRRMVRKNEKFIIIGRDRKKIRKDE